MAAKADNEEILIKKIFTVCIQLGTNSCCIAELPLHQNRDPTAIRSFIFVDNGQLPGISMSFPPALFVADEVYFGYQATTKYLEHLKGVYVENILSSIYSLKEIHSKSLIEDARGNTQIASTIARAFLTEIKKFVLDHFRSTLGEKEMSFVLTIPSVRAEKFKMFIKEAWKLEFPDEEVDVVTYPEAVITYYLYQPRRTRSGFSLKDIDIGDRVMVIGFEDEIDSFNTYEKRNNLNYKQVTHYLSTGSTREIIEQRLDCLFSDLLGTWVWNTLKQLDETVWPRVRKRLNCLLETNFTDRMIINFDGFSLLDWVCKEYVNTSVKEVIANSDIANSVKYSYDILRIDQSLVSSIFNKGIEKVIHNITHVMSLEEKEVKLILLAGNIANSPLVLERIKQNFPQSQVLGGREVDALYAALKGGALYGHKPVVFSTLFSGAQVFAPKLQ